MKQGGYANGKREKIGEIASGTAFHFATAIVAHDGLYARHPSQANLEPPPDTKRLPLAVGIYYSPELKTYEHVGARRVAKVEKGQGRQTGVRQVVERMRNHDQGLGLEHLRQGTGVPWTTACTIAFP